MIQFIDQWYVNYDHTGGFMYNIESQMMLDKSNLKYTHYLLALIGTYIHRQKAKKIFQITV